MMDDVRREEPSSAPGLPQMPARLDVEGVAFVEFAARAEEAETLEDLLRTLGFQHSGNHISKRLSLWTQGDIRIVVNRETTGFASSSYVTHGMSVCDIGISVNDATQAVSRAKSTNSKSTDSIGSRIRRTT